MKIIKPMPQASTSMAAYTVGLTKTLQNVLHGDGLINRFISKNQPLCLWGWSFEITRIYLHVYAYYPDIVKFSFSEFADTKDQAEQSFMRS